MKKTQVVNQLHYEGSGDFGDCFSFRYRHCGMEMRLCESSLPGKESQICECGYKWRLFHFARGDKSE